MHALLIDIGNTSLKIGVACIIMKMSAAASTTIAARKIMLSSALMKKHMIMLQMSISGARTAMRRII